MSLIYVKLITFYSIYLKQKIIKNILERYTTNTTKNLSATNRKTPITPKNCQRRFTNLQILQNSVSELSRN